MTAMSETPGVGKGAAGASVPRRLGRVARQLVVVGASAAVYFALVTWLLDRFGQRGFLYALLVLAAVMALLREFGPDLGRISARVREAGRRWRERRAQVADASAGEEDATAPPTPPPPASSRAEAEAAFKRESERLERGEITAEAFDQFARGSAFIDTSGKFWTMQPETGAWTYFKGGAWHPGLPLGVLTRGGSGNR